MSRKIKKVISVLVIATLFVMSFAGISLSYVSAAADVTAPIVDVSTLRVSQKTRSEERRVGKECRSRWSPYH